MNPTINSKDMSIVFEEMSDDLRSLLAEKYRRSSGVLIDEEGKRHVYFPQNLKDGYLCVCGHINQGSALKDEEICSCCERHKEQMFRFFSKEAVDQICALELEYKRIEDELAQFKVIATVRDRWMRANKILKYTLTALISILIIASFVGLAPSTLAVRRMMERRSWHVRPSNKIPSIAMIIDQEQTWLGGLAFRVDYTVEMHLFSLEEITERIYLVTYIRNHGFGGEFGFMPRYRLHEISIVSEETRPNPNTDAGRALIRALMENN